jgi:hypothetical protein
MLVSNPCFVPVGTERRIHEARTSVIRRREYAHDSPSTAGGEGGKNLGPGNGCQGSCLFNGAPANSWAQE